MIALGIALLILAAEPAVEPPTKLHPGTVKRVEAAHAYLISDEELQTHHAGYLAWLHAHPEVAEKERSWWDVNIVSETHALNAAFDEAIMGDVLAQTLYDQFYDELNRNPELRTKVDTLQNLEWSFSAMDQALSKGLNLVKAQPQQSLERITKLPDAAEDLTINDVFNQISQHPELARALQQQLGGLMEDTSFFSRILPWWEAVQGGAPAWQGPHLELTQHFAQYPHRFWIWHKRNLALSTDAHTRNWIRYWQRRVRREPALQNIYTEVLRQDFDTQRYAATITDWPPKAAPPVLKALPKSRTQKPGTNKPTITSPNKGTRPTSPRPGVLSPTRPVAPLRPDPDKADKPIVKGNPDTKNEPTLKRPVRPVPPQRTKSSGAAK